MFVEDFSLEGGLTKEQIDLMHEKALYLIEKVGIHIPHEGILDILSNYAGVKIKKENVKFGSDLVLKALKKAKYALPEYAKDNWIISAGAHQMNIIDSDTGKVRKTTLKDLIDLIKLGDALDTVGSAPVVPLDVPTHLQHILMHKIAWEYSRYRCNDIYEHMDKPTIECADYLYEMAKVAAKRFTFGIWVVSPRSFNKYGLEVAYRLLDKGVPMWVLAMPIAGVTAPITMQGAILQSMFEHFAGLTMLNLINTKSYNYISPAGAFEAAPFDMRYSTFVHGSPEYTRSTLYKIALNKYYNIPIVAKSLFTASKEPDAQAAFEIGVHTLIAALAGARVFRCGGLLSIAQLYSAEQLVIVYEIVEYIKNLKKEEFNQERLMVDEIAEVGPGQSFIGRKSTFDNFRKEYWEPTLFIRTNLDQWMKMGSKSIRQYAREIAKKKTEEHTYKIDEDIKRELDKIYERAKNDAKLQKSYKY